MMISVFLLSPGLYSREYRPHGSRELNSILIEEQKRFTSTLPSAQQELFFSSSLPERLLLAAIVPHYRSE